MRHTLVQREPVRVWFEAQFTETKGMNAWLTCVERPLGNYVASVPYIAFKVHIRLNQPRVLFLRPVSLVVFVDLCFDRVVFNLFETFCFHRNRHRFEVCFKLYLEPFELLFFFWEPNDFGFRFRLCCWGACRNCAGAFFIEFDFYISNTTDIRLTVLQVRGQTRLRNLNERHFPNRVGSKQPISSQQSR